MRVFIRIQILISFLLFAGASHGTTGYFSLAYGANSLAMAGATTAAPQDALTVANNPAGISWLDERTDVSHVLYKPMSD